MELRRIIIKLWSARLFILSGAVLLALAAYTFSSAWPVSYRSSLNLYVNRRIQEAPDKYYTFDGYYSQQAAERYTQTVIGILQSSDVLKGAAEAVSLPTEEAFLKQLSRSVRIREQAPQLILLTVIRSDLAQSEMLSLSLAKVAIEKLAALNQSGDRDLAIEQVSANPTVETLSPQPVLNLLLAFISGLVIFSLLSGFRSYLKE